VVASPTANVLFDGSGRLALSPALEHIAVWNLKQGVLVHMLHGDKAEVTRMVASPDNERIAVGYADGRICIWHVAKREITLTLNGHRYDG
jgi:U3 small nucleolar RNA-associated protein 12